MISVYQIEVSLILLVFQNQSPLNVPGQYQKQGNKNKKNKNLYKTDVISTHASGRKYMIESLSTHNRLDLVTALSLHKDQVSIELVFSLTNAV